MGLKLAGAAHRCDAVQGTTKSVLNVLAVLADDAAGWCWPSVDWIARAVGRCVRHVQRLLVELEAAGLLEVKRAAGRGRLNRYRVVLDSWKRVTSPAACARSACGQPAVSACGQASGAQPEKVTSAPIKGDTHVTQQRSYKKEKVAPNQPVDKSRSWARGFSLGNGFFATSSFASFGRGRPCRPGGSPLPGSPPCMPRERSTTPSGTSSCSSQSVAELVAAFLAERQAVPR